MIPLVLIAVSNFINNSNKKLFFSILIVVVLTTGITTYSCMAIYKPFNYVFFSEPAKLVMSKIPSLYNPPMDVFLERAKGEEVDMFQIQNYVPVGVANDSGIRKAAISNNGKILYINGSVKLNSSSKLTTVALTKGESSILKIDSLQYYDSGWRDLEKSMEYFRWSYKKSNLYFSLNKEEKNKKISLDILSFQTNKVCEIYFNDNIVFKDIITPDYRNVTFVVDVKLINKLTIVSPEDVKNNTNEICFNIKNITVN
jgi:hypothetical protein